MKALSAFIIGLFLKFPIMVFGVESKIRHVSVLFRHGDRNPEVSVTKFPNDPYMDDSYFPEGSGELTNEGKRRMYHLGQILRKKYGDFLGNYERDEVYGVSTYYSRTKMSLQLVLAGLYPPKSSEQTWNDNLHWMPIPVTYLDFKEDMLFNSRFCPRYVEECNRVMSLPEVKKKLDEFWPTEKKTAIFLGRTPPISVHDILTFTTNMMIENSMNLTLPLWMSDLLSDGSIVNDVIYRFTLDRFSDQLKKLHGGMLLRKISNDMVTVSKRKTGRGNKLSLYSGHDLNIASFQNALGVYKPHIPLFSSAIIVELLTHRDQYFVKVLYYLGIPAEIEELTIPGCATLCPLERFLDLLAPVTPSNDDMNCTKIPFEDFPVNQP